MSDVQDAERDASQDDEALGPVPADVPSEPDAQVEPTEPATPPGPAQFRLRRAPRYRAFGGTGLVLGVVIGLVIAYSRPADGDYSAQTIAGYFAASFGLIGAVIGMGAAVLADRRRR